MSFTKHLCFLDLDSSGLTTPGATPDLPSLPSDVLGVDRVQGAPGGDARWHPLLFAPYSLHSSSLCSHFLFLDSNQATPSLFAVFPVPPAPVPTPIPGKPPSLPPGARPGDQMLEEFPGLTSHQAITPILQKTEAQTEREISELRQQGAEPWTLSFWSRTLEDSRIVIMNPRLALCASDSGSPPVPLPQKVPVVSCCTGPCQFCS